MGDDAGHVHEPDPLLPVVFDRVEARAAGLSEDQIARRLRSREWDRLRRGRYRLAVGHPDDVRWRAEVLAHIHAHTRSLVLSHTSAARAWHLPNPLGGWGPISFTARDGSPRSGPPRVRVAPLTDGDVTVMGAVAVTSLARTVVDCARTIPGHEALAMADRALRIGVTRVDLEVVLEGSKGWPGARRARLVVARADGRRESTAESWSAWALAENEVPSPTWQVEICDGAGAFLGRADAWWEPGVVGEVDGRLKYRLGALQRGGLTAEHLAAVLDEERLREMGIRRTGAVLVRWDPVDVLRPDRAARLASHLHAQIARAGGFTGRIHLP